ncbi:queuosine precursor transporter [Aminipila terrae]|uniref:Probable queuosine precursor transporter n=1 Tax=Aminipila terrae TaxID=2697030 RepID=A0A6P1MQY0_9FIRM|nr:queuosine precursor transporter [Aminipila terrae]QHI73405.1 queuosine precursor transporter [Aminipila terrae]
MNNEILLITTLIVLYSVVLIWYRLFGRTGLLCWIVFATIAANIEVLILVDAFGIEQTLGNVMFATTFMVTDILSETEGKKVAKKAVNIGILTSITFIAVSQAWLMYTPSVNDWAFPSIKAIFSNTPRLMFVSLGVYAIVQRFDVWAYNKVWAATNKICNDTKKYLWLRNNASTLLSQLLNTVLFSLGAFWGTYPLHTLISIILSSYVIFVVTSIADTPFVYAARKMSYTIKAKQPF